LNNLLKVDFFAQKYVFICISSPQSTLEN